MFYLYHKAHGRDVDAVRSGGELVMDALTRDGKLMSDTKDDHVSVFNYSDNDEEEAKDEELSEDMAKILEANQRFADQQAERQVDSVMSTMTNTEHKR